VTRAQGYSVPALAALERRLCERFGAPELAALGHGPSLPALLEARSALLAAVAGGPGGGPAAPLGDVLRVTAAALAALSREGDAAAASAGAEPTAGVDGAGGAESTSGAVAAAADAEAGAVARALCQHFGAPAVERLGHGGVGGLIARARRRAWPGGTPVWPACALAAGWGSGDGAGGSGGADAAPPAEPSAAGRRAGVVGRVDRGAALRCLRAAPDLADLAAWSQWGAAFEPSLGPLGAFLRAEAAAASADVLALALPLGPVPVLALPLPGGGLLKLPPAADEAAFAERASRGDARGAAAALLSLVAQAGGLARAPLALLASHMGACLAALAAEGGLTGGDVADVGRPGAAQRAAGGAAAARFALGVLRLLPFPLLAPLAQRVVLAPLAGLLGGEAGAADALLAAARGSHADRSALHHLGFALGVPPWQADFERLLLAASVEERGGPEGRDDDGGGGSVAAAAAALAPAATAISDTRTSLEGGGEDDAALLALLGASAAPATAAPTAPAAAAAAADGATELAPSSASRRAVVEAIRREEFGLGLSLGAAGGALAERQNARIGRALQRLSTELYSKDSHFVLELVQARARARAGGLFWGGEVGQRARCRRHAAAPPLRRTRSR